LLHADVFCFIESLSRVHFTSRVGREPQIEFT